jgi:hypothetical protein
LFIVDELASYLAWIIAYAGMTSNPDIGLFTVAAITLSNSHKEKDPAVSSVSLFHYMQPFDC